MAYKLKKTFIILAPFILLFGAISISLIPDFYRISITPAEKTYSMLHNHLTDYYYYLSLMHQGYEGNWLLTSRVTPENFKPAFAQTFFALLGHLSRIFEISLPITYFISRIIFGVVLLLAIIFLVRRIFTNKYYHIFSCFLVFFSTGFWILTNKNGVFEIKQFLDFWTRLDPILRTTYLPHHVVSTALGVLSVVFLSESIEKKNLKKAVIAGVCGFLAGFIYFASMINIFGGVVVSFLIFAAPKIITKSGGGLRIRIMPLLLFVIYFFVCSLSFIYFFLLAKTTFPWSSYNSSIGLFVFGISLSSYIAALGPVFFLALLGIKKIIKEEKWLPKLLLGWVIFPFIGLFLLSRIFWRFADVYYLEAASYIPLGILAVYGVDFLRRKFFVKREKLFLLLPISLIIYFSIPLVSSVQKEIKRYGTNYYNIYIPNEILTGIKWLDANSARQSVVLAGGDFGSIIPAFTANKVVFGHGSGTNNVMEKRQDMFLFFAQKNKKKAEEVLRKYGVSYVFFAQDTDQPVASFIRDLPLKSVFENNYVRIYKVIK